MTMTMSLRKRNCLIVFAIVVFVPFCLFVFLSVPDFPYVVNTKEGSRICFGTTAERNTNPIGRGLSSYQKHYVQEVSSIGPGYYHTEKVTSALFPLLNKVRSKVGVGPLASKDPRFKERICFRTPSPGRYDITKIKSTRKNMAPFGNSSKLRQTKTNNNPGPPTYNVAASIKNHHKPKSCHFGKPKRSNAVEMICISKPNHACFKCSQICQGDYWQKDYHTFLCQKCWEEEKNLAEIYDEGCLKTFKKIRNCSFMHNHQDTSAAIIHLPPSKVKKKLRLENYLSAYLNN